ncbi:hypothetical protein [Bacillus sp. D12]|uniref:hypothetical protein n=2 Tax=Bacillales TaxID=1385 RepID=UPI0011207C1B|nr:hypothetical protein [Bacillus sp. D12]
MMKRSIPYFEALVSILSYYLAMVCMFNNDMFQQLPELYGTLSQLGSETLFALIFFSAATIKVIGLVINSYVMRKFGLGLSALIYLIIAVSYATSEMSLNWGAGIFFLLSAFSLLNIFEVRHTKLME